MNLDKLKRAWHIYKVEHSLDRLESDAILSIIEAPEARTYAFSKTAVINGLLLPLLMVCCQGG